MKVYFLILSAAVVCALSGCGGSTKTDTGDGYTPVPRRHAYPRMVLPDSTFTETDTGNGGLVIAVNSAAGLTRRERDRNGSQFIDVSYPGLNSTIHFTFTPVNGATAGEVIGNRMERIGLNLGASEAELLEFDSPAGFENKVFVSRGDISTPVQFISTDGHSTVVSGAAFVSTASAATADSITPVVDMLRRDIVHALKTMHR